MALGPRLDLRQSQSLVMTPQLQQAIKLLALSNLEIEAFIGDALDANPLLEISDGAPAPAAEELPGDAELRRTTLESSPVDQLVNSPASRAPPTPSRLVMNQPISTAPG